MHLLDVDGDDSGRLLLTVETDQAAMGCRSCGVVAVATVGVSIGCTMPPVSATPTVVRWRKRVWRCLDPRCPVGTFSEMHDLAAPRAKLTTRAIGWATDALTHDDTTVSALARHLGWTGTPCGTRSRSRPRPACSTRTG